MAATRKSQVTVASSSAQSGSAARTAGSSQVAAVAVAVGVTVGVALGVPVGEAVEVGVAATVALVVGVRAAVPRPLPLQATRPALAVMATSRVNSARATIGLRSPLRHAISVRDHDAQGHRFGIGHRVPADPHTGSLALQTGHFPK